MGASNIGGHQKDRKSRNKSLGSAESGGRTAAADLKREPVLTTTRARRSRRSDRTETWRAPSRPSARSRNASNQPIGPDGRTGVSSSSSALPTKSQVHFCHLTSLPGSLACNANSRIWGYRQSLSKIDKPCLRMVHKLCLHFSAAACNFRS